MKGSSAPVSIVRKAVYISGEWLYALRGECGYRSVTITVDPMTGEFSVPGGVDHESGDPIQFIQLEFDDDVYDINMDGRFNQGDVDLLPQFLGATSDTEVGLYDLDGDMAVTMQDLSLFQALIDSGLGSGEFGDANGEGVPSCDELDDLVALGDASLCDSPYVIEFDFDLDGYVDSSDVAEMMAVARPRGDLDGDGIVGAGDLGLLLSAWGSDDPLADTDGSGNVGPEDLGFLLSTWDRTSCE